MTGARKASRAWRGWLARLSLREQLLWGILMPVGLFILVDTFSLYRQALAAADTAYDRTLLASAKSIGEQLEVDMDVEPPRVKAVVPYSALEAFEADNRSRMFYKVSGFSGEMISGFADLPPWRGTLPTDGPYAALVDFYDDKYLGQPVRVAVLLQPVAGSGAQGMATIQVAETLELRRTLARRILTDTLWRQAILLAVIAGIVIVVVHRTTQPVRQLSEHLRQRGETDLAPLEAPDAPRELLPLVDATNQVIARLDQLLAHQKRFVRDTSHQLRTPLAVLKAQVQSARRGEVDPETALEEIGQTVERATQLANQMLSLAKVEQLRQQPGAVVQAWDEIVRAVALDVAPLVAEREIEFELDATTCLVHAHEWALRELTRNLLHNAIKYSPAHGRILVTVAPQGRHAVMTIMDSGPGIPDDLRARLGQPFASGNGGGSGLGLAICTEITRSLGGRLDLTNNATSPDPCGLTAIVRLPLADPFTPPLSPMPEGS